MKQSLAAEMTESNRKTWELRSHRKYLRLTAEYQLDTLKTHDEA
jgi:hypothetical protein